jgi:sodium-dependent dicarboxylate transporter 2/3/5
MLMISYGAGVGGLLTPIGTPPNLIGIGFIEQATGTRITFFNWVLMAAPIVLAMFVVLCIVLLLLNRPEVRRISGAQEYIAQQRAELGPMSRGEKNTLIVFFVAVTLWVLPGIIALIAGDESTVYTTVLNKLDEGTVAILAAALLFVLPIDWAERRFTMNWNDAAGIDWGTIILFGCGIALGTLMGETGFAEVLGTGIADSLGFSSLLAISAVSALIAILISETTSNTASATIVVPIVIPIASAAGVNPMIPALAAVFGASFGFMMPVSTPQNAVVYGSGLIPITKMVRSGIAFDIAGLVLTVALIPIMASLVGLV